MLGDSGPGDSSSRLSYSYFFSLLYFLRVENANLSSSLSSFFFLFRFYLFIFRERGWEGDREGEKHQCVVASDVPPTGDLSLIHISEPTRPPLISRMPSSA